MIEKPSENYQNTILYYATIFGVFTQ